MLQTLIVGLIVLAALGYLVRRAVVAARPAKDGCGGDCGCGH